jgi:cytochrome c oxidase subunit 2
MSVPVAGTAGWPPPVLDPAGPLRRTRRIVSWILFGMAAAVLLILF